MVRKDSGITSTSQFKNGISACTNIGTTTELNMRVSLSLQQQKRKRPAESSFRIQQKKSRSAEPSLLLVLESLMSLPL
jgi:hypothetical protein